MKKGWLVVLLICISLSCDDEIYSPIPNAQVHIELDLNFDDSELVAKSAYKMFTQPRKGVDRLGFGGILVINGFGMNIVDLYAYDLACPVEVDRSIKVEPDATTGKATCPQCNAVYDIAYGAGRPESGTKHSLKIYRVSPREGNRYIVSN